MLMKLTLRFQFYQHDYKQLFHIQMLNFYLINQHTLIVQFHSLLSALSTPNLFNVRCAQCTKKDQINLVAQKLHIISMLIKLTPN
jgi:hypothetical protein